MTHCKADYWDDIMKGPWVESSRWEAINVVGDYLDWVIKNGWMDDTPQTKPKARQRRIHETILRTITAKGDHMARQPIHEIRHGLIKVRIWREQTSSDLFHTLTIVRLYRNGDVWKESTHFSRDDIPLAGDDCRYDTRSPHTVNSVLRAVMAFIRFCKGRGWVAEVPDLQKVEFNEVMKGRPITEAEFQKMLDVTESVVGEDSAPSWIFAMKVLRESAFRAGDLMDFSWDNPRHIHPIWPTQPDRLPTIAIPSSQKNGRVQEIPMLPGLEELLSSVPEHQRSGWVVNPKAIEFDFYGGTESFRPCASDLRRLAIRKPTERLRHGTERITKERVSRIIGLIGKKADIVAQLEDPRTHLRIKYASAHDIRRGLAKRLINAGVSAETLKVVMRHTDFATTEKHYGAVKSAQNAGAEIVARWSPAFKNSSFWGD